MARAIARTFERTAAYEQRLEEISQTIDLIERMGQSAMGAFLPLGELQQQLIEIVSSFKQIQPILPQVADLGRTFAPMQLMHDQVVQLADQLRGELGQLVKGLDSFRDFADRLMALAKPFDSLIELRDEFVELSSNLDQSQTRAPGNYDEPGEWSEARDSEGSSAALIH